MLFTISFWATIICLAIFAIFIIILMICLGVDSFFHEEYDDPKSWVDNFFNFFYKIPHVGRYLTIFFIFFIFFIGMLVTAAVTEPEEMRTEKYRITEQNEERIVLEKDGSDTIYIINLADTD